MHNPWNPAVSRRTFLCGAALAACGATALWASPSPARADEPTETILETNVAPSTCGSLHVEGTQLCDEQGNAVQLRGISTHGLAWFPDYVNEECFKQLHDEWGASVVRLAMYTAESGGWCTDGDRDWLRSLIATGVQAATNADLYVIIDWHILSDADPNIYLDEALAFFDEMAQTYADHPNVIYEICNEPNGGTSWESVKAYAEQVIPVIRAHAPEAIILVGTPNWSQYVDQAAADPITDYDNLMYVLHFYAATHTDDLRATMAGAVANGLPIFVSEFGICDASGNGAIDTEQADAWVSLMDELGISYIMWNLSNKDESSSALVSTCTKTSGFTADDLSTSGTWLRDTLTGARTPNEAAQELAQSAVAAGDQASPSPAPASGAPAQTVATNGSLSCSAQLRSSWEAEGKTCLLIDLTIKNGGDSPCESWSVDVPFTEAFELQDGWNGTFTVAGNILQVANADYNGAIGAGQSVTDVGIIVAGSSALAIAGA